MSAYDSFCSGSLELNRSSRVPRRMRRTGVLPDGTVRREVVRLAASTAYVYADERATCRGRNPCRAQSPGFFALVSAIVAREDPIPAIEDWQAPPSRSLDRARGHPGCSRPLRRRRDARPGGRHGQRHRKDLYVDLIYAGVFTGELVALQVKGCSSHRTTSGAHRIRTTAHDRLLWANTPVLVFGIVHDPYASAELRMGAAISSLARYSSTAWRADSRRLSCRMRVHRERRLRPQAIVAGGDSGELADRVTAVCRDLRERHARSHERRHKGVAGVV